MRTSRDVEAIYELSPLQEGMLVECLVAPDEGRYVEQVVIRLDGNVKLPAMARAWQQIVDRHAVLRTSFHWRDLERPLQAVHRRASVPVRSTDLGGIAASRQDRAVQDFLLADRRRGFDLETTPLLRVAVLRCSPRSVVVVITTHHVVLDGWSLGIVMDEFGRIYEAETRGARCALPVPPPYSRFIQWLSDDEPARSAEHWRHVLRGYGGAPPIGMLDGARSRSGRSPAGELRRQVPEELVRRLRDVAQRHRVTLNTVALGGWGLALAATLATDDVVVGTVVSGRDSPVDGVDSIVGLLINTIAVRMPVGHDAPVGDFLAELHHQLIASREHQHCALTRVHGWSDVPRGRPLFESIFVFENHLAAGPGSPRPQGRAQAFERTGAPLTVIVDAESTLRLTVLYDGETVDADGANRLADRYLHVLDRVATEGAAFGLGELVEPHGQERLDLERFGCGVVGVVSGGSVGGLWAERVAAAGGAGGVGGGGVAVVVGGRSVSFGELGGLVDGLVVRLGRPAEDGGCGVGVGDAVGVGVGLSLEYVVAVLAVWKLGGVVVPVDVGGPVGQVGWPVGWVLGEAGVGVVLVGRADDVDGVGLAGVGGVGGVGGVEVVVVDVGELAAAGSPVSGGVVGWGVSDRVWVLFTSGSSGRPKGVVGSLAGLLNRLGWWWRAVPFVAGDRVVLKTRPGFVDAVCELLAPLLAGVPVVVADEVASRDPGALARLVVAGEVTHVTAVPSVLSVMFEDHAGVLAGSRLRVVVSSGEVLSAGLVRLIRSVIPGVTIVNLYGSTEVSGDATALVIEPGVVVGERVPIGRPIDNVTVVVADAAGRPVPIGAVGEVVVGGVAVTHGYTAGAAPGDHDRFVDVGGAVMFRTGDLARWTSRGELEYLGRGDRQVKIRGIRVEPGEIEHVLSGHPQVTGSAVVARDDPTRGWELVACVVVDDPTMSPAVLRRYLATHLPDHHVPNQFVMVDRLPRLPNGKLDYTTLTGHTGHTNPGDPSDSEDAESLGAVERIIADVFTEMLGVDRVTASDDFFTLGGHSLLATRVVSAISKRFEIAVPMAALFDHPSVGGLAREIEELLVADVRRMTADDHRLLSDQPSPDRPPQDTGDG